MVGKVAKLKNEVLGSHQADQGILSRPGDYSSPLAPRERAILFQAAQKAAEDRQRRRTLFGDWVGSDPSWDILLSLSIAKWGSSNASFNTLCETASTTDSTLSRHLSVLSSTGLIARFARPDQSGSATFTLTASGERAMRSYLSQSLH
jgi:DNA-binding HxlR family transcriptional regulator